MPESGQGLSSEGGVSPHVATRAGSSRTVPPGLQELADHLGDDVQTAIAGLDGRSESHVLFATATNGDPSRPPIRLRADHSLLRVLLMQPAPRVVNDLREALFDEEGELLKRGIRSYIAIHVNVRGWDPGAVLFASPAVRFFDALKIGALLEQVDRWASDLGPAESAEGSPSTTIVHEDTLIGESAEFLEVCRLAALAARQDTTLLIQGESGTGKELLAKTVHRYSRRKDKPFIRVNCAALTETLVESELFGHKKGAFTGAIENHIGRFAAADGGTLLLDEIGNMTLSGQAKLLRVLQEREYEPVGQSVSIPVDVRIIATTNVELEQAIESGTFRRDLYYRLAVLPLSIPPLRGRKRDILPLARYFLDRSAAEAGKPNRRLAPETCQALEAHSWPGNVRELKNAIDHAVVVARGDEIRRRDLPGRAGHTAKGRSAEPGTMRERVLQFERDLVTEAYCRGGGKRSAVARILGLDPRNLNYFLKKHGIR